MLIAGAPLSSLPVSASPYDFSVPTTFSQFLQNIGSEHLIYLVEMSPIVRDTSGPTVDTKRYSIGSNVPDYDGVLWEARLLEDPEIDTRVFSNEIIGGLNRPSFSPIELSNGDGELDALRDLEWYRRDVSVYLGGRNFDFSDFQLVVVGVVESLRWTSGRIAFNLTDRLGALNTPFQETLYAGTGGDEGGDDIKGTPKPRALGSPKNVTPVLVERAENVFQFNDRASNAVIDVFDQAVSISPANSGANDITDLGIADVRDWTPVAGQYITDLEKGLIRTGAEPAGTLTADVEGDLDGTIFLQSTADVVRWIVAGSPDAPLVDPDDLDAASFADVNLRQGGDISLYSVDAGVTIEQLAARLMAAAGGYLTVTQAGKLKVDILRFKTPSNSIPFEDVIELERSDPPRAFWRRKLSYDKAWTVQPQDDIDESAATDARKNFVQQEFRFETDEDLDVKEELLESRDGEAETFFDSSAVASAEATRQLNLLGTRRDLYNMRLRGWAWRLEAGQTITVTHPDMRVTTGQDLIIGRVAETGGGTTEVTCWG